MIHPTYISKEEDYKEWRLNGQLHRDNDLPAITIECEDIAHWYQYGQLHREKGPAVINLDEGIVEWWINGIQCKTHAEYQKAANISDEDMTVIILKYGNISRTCSF